MHFFAMAITIFCTAGSLLLQGNIPFGRIGLYAHAHIYVARIDVARSHSKKPQAYADKYPCFHPLLKMYYFHKILFLQRDKHQI